MGPSPKIYITNETANSPEGKDSPLWGVPSRHLHRERERYYTYPPAGFPARARVSAAPAPAVGAAWGWREVKWAGGLHLGGPLPTIPATPGGPHRAHARPQCSPRAQEEQKLQGRAPLELRAARAGGPPRARRRRADSLAHLMLCPRAPAAGRRGRPCAHAERAPLCS